MCHTPDRSRGPPSGAQQLGTVHGRSLTAAQEVSRVYANGKCWKGLVEAIYSLFPKVFVGVATSLEHPGGTFSVSVFYHTAAGPGTSDCIAHLWGTKENWGYSKEIWQSPVLNEDSRPLVSILVLAKWKRHIREASFTVVC